jgi:hypothetical protein
LRSRDVEWQRPAEQPLDPTDEPGECGARGGNEEIRARAEFEGVAAPVADDRQQRLGAQQRGDRGEALVLV